MITLKNCGQRFLLCTNGCGREMFTAASEKQDFHEIHSTTTTTKYLLLFLFTISQKGFGL